MTEVDSGKNESREPAFLQGFFIVFFLSVLSFFTGIAISLIGNPELSIGEHAVKGLIAVRYGVIASFAFYDTSLIALAYETDRKVGVQRFLGAALAYAMLGAPLYLTWDLNFFH
mgnify:CR=1 FL=1